MEVAVKGNSPAQVQLLFVFYLFFSLVVICLFQGRAKRRHLNADELQESESGLEALINPQNLSRSGSSTSGLNPRTTKRRNCGDCIALYYNLTVDDLQRHY